MSLDKSRKLLTAQLEAKRTCSAGNKPAPNAHRPARASLKQNEVFTLCTDYLAEQCVDIIPSMTAAQPPCLPLGVIMYSASAKDSRALTNGSFAGSYGQRFNNFYRLLVVHHVTAFHDVTFCVGNQRFKSPQVRFRGQCICRTP